MHAASQPNSSSPSHTEVLKRLMEEQRNPMQELWLIDCVVETKEQPQLKED